MSTKELRPWLKITDEHDGAAAVVEDHWPEVRSALEAGTYRPQPVRRVTIPKPSGGLRMLGVPAAVDQRGFGAGGVGRPPPRPLRARPDPPERHVHASRPGEKV